MTTAPLTDDQLVEAARAGDRDAYCELVRRHQAGLHAFVARLVASRQDVPDLVQDAFINAYRSLGRFEPGRPFGPWIRAICRNRVANHLRDRATARRSCERAVEEAILEVTPPDGGDDDLARLKALQACADQLSGDARELLALRYQQGVPVGDIARRLTRTPAAVSMTLMRIRAALIRCVQQRLAAGEGGP